LDRTTARRDGKEANQQTQCNLLSAGMHGRDIDREGEIFVEKITKTVSTQFATPLTDCSLQVNR
jgi:hypothetical protein